jgi:uncharacterized membrane protein
MQRWIWKLFYLLIAVIVVHNVGLVFGVHLSKNIFFHTLLLILPVSLFLLHTIYTLGIKRSLLFILLTSGTGWAMETIGLKYGVVFGGRYIYEGNQWMVGIVPLSVVLYWAVFIYTGYNIVCSFLYWLHKNKPVISKNSFYQLILLILFDAALVTIIDLFMDPIQVQSGAWQWLDGGKYFGIPIGNFFGWFITAFLSVGIFRITEYVLPIKTEQKDASLFILPTIAYGMLAVSFSISAIQFGLYSLVVIGLSLMFPVVIANLYLYTKYKGN